MARQHGSETVLRIQFHRRAKLLAGLGGLPREPQGDPQADARRNLPRRQRQRLAVFPGSLAGSLLFRGSLCRGRGSTATSARRAGWPPRRQRWPRRTAQRPDRHAPERGATWASVGSSRTDWLKAAMVSTALPLVRRTNPRTSWATARSGCSLMARRTSARASSRAGSMPVGVRQFAVDLSRFLVVEQGEVVLLDGLVELPLGIQDGGQVLAGQGVFRPVADCSLR